jgi:hypothetical protein
VRGIDIVGHQIGRRFGTVLGRTLGSLDDDMGTELPIRLPSK